MTRLRTSLPLLAAIMLAACQGATTATQAPPSTAPVATPPASAGGGSAAPGKIDLFNTAYKPDAGTDGGQIIIGDWQEANQFNPFYAGQVTEANVASAVWATLVVFTHDYKYAPDLAADVPTLDNGGVKVPGSGSDAMTVTWKLRSGLKWSDGEPLTCDDFKFAQEWVLDKDNTGDRDAHELPGDQRRRLHERHGDGLALPEDLRGLHHPRRRAVAAPLLQGLRDQGHGRGQGLPLERDQEHRRSAARSSSTRSPRAASSGSSRTRTTRASRSARPPTSIPSSGSGTATPTR